MPLTSFVGLPAEALRRDLSLAACRRLKAALQAALAAPTTTDASAAAILPTGPGSAGGYQGGGEVVGGPGRLAGNAYGLRGGWADGEGGGDREAGEGKVKLGGMDAAGLAMISNAVARWVKSVGNGGACASLGALKFGGKEVWEDGGLGL